MNRFLPLLLGFFLTSLAWSDDVVDDETVESTHVVMHKNPGCGCCDLWAEHLRTYGFTVESIEDYGILGFKADRKIPGPGVPIERGLRWGVSPTVTYRTSAGKSELVHDDRLLSAALVAEADRLYKTGQWFASTGESAVITRKQVKKDEW